MKFKFDPLFLARILIVLELIALCVSTAATVVIEILILVMILGFSSLRYRLFATLKQPMVAMALVLFAMVGLGSTHSVAPLSESLDMWGSWRKYLLLPIAAALYDDPRWKQRFALIFVALMTFAASLALTGHLFNFTIYHRFPVGIVVDNHSTQGIFFSVAVFTCMALIKFPSEIPGPPQWLLGLASVIMTVGIFLTPGRSGYLAFMIYGMALVFWGYQGKKRWFLMLVVPSVILMGVMSFPVAKERTLKGLREIQTHDQYRGQTTAMGIRILWWKNTLAMLKKMEHPIIGYGTSGFELAYAKQVADQEIWQSMPTTDPHNQYLKIWVEHGFLGLIVFLIFIVSFFRQKVPNTFYYMGIGTLLVWCATSMFSGHFTTFHEGRFLILWCGIMLTTTLKKKSNQEGHGEQ